MIDVILHIGRHKTGTSSLQVYLDKNTKLLESNNFIYPRMFYRGNAHHIFGESLKKSITNNLSEKEIKELTHEYRRKIVRRFLHRGKTLIFSSESFQNCDPKVIRQVFNPQRFNVKVICYFRDQVSYYCSAYNQRVHANLFHTDVEKFYNEAFDGDYLKFSDSWSSVFEQFECRIFQKDHLYNKDVVSDFCYEVLNIDAVDLNKELSNPSLSRRFLAFKLMLNQEISSGSLSLKINDKQLYRLIGERSRYDDSGKYQLPLSLTEKIMKRYEKNNEQFSEKYLEGKKLIFPELPCDKPHYQMGKTEFLEILDIITLHHNPLK